MLAAVDLDDQPRFVANEVGNERSDRHLTAKPEPVGLPRPQYLPEPPLGFGHRTAQRPGAIAGTRARLFLHHWFVLGIITPIPALPRLRGYGIHRSSTCPRPLDGGGVGWG
jgi:hypothetical protein